MEHGQQVPGFDVVLQLFLFLRGSAPALVPFRQLAHAGERGEIIKPGGVGRGIADHKGNLFGNR